MTDADTKRIEEIRQHLNEIQSGGRWIPDEEQCDEDGSMCLTGYLTFIESNPVSPVDGDGWDGVNQQAAWFGEPTDAERFVQLLEDVKWLLTWVEELPTNVDFIPRVTDGERAVLEQLTNQGASIVDFGHPDKVTLTYAAHELAPVPRAIFMSLRARIKPLIEHKPGTGWVITDIGRAAITTLAVHDQDQSRQDDLAEV